jgi:ABC-type Fe3+-hydroxamate transport system substrate-binding protein
VLPPEAIAEREPDYVIILPWNLREEIAEQLSGIRAWGGRFVTAIPELRVF